jgi:hypothetical protein
MRKGGHHYHQLISHARPHHGDGANLSNPKLIDRLGGTCVCSLNAMHGTHIRANIATRRDNTDSRMGPDLPRSTG